MVSSTAICWYFHTRICRQDPDMIIFTISLEIISLITWSCRSLIQGHISVYHSSIYIPESFPKGNNHRPMNHRYYPVLYLSLRPHPICHPWDNWISVDEANGKYLTWHQSHPPVYCQSSWCHHMIPCQQYDTVFSHWCLVLKQANS